jgi:hypothetical protein
MAVTLLEVAQSSDNTLKQGIVQTIVETSPGLAMAPFETVPSLRYEYSKEGDLPSSAFRAENAAYTASKGGFNRDTIHLKYLGGMVDIDRKLMNVPTLDGVNQMSKQLSMLSRSVGLNLKKYAFTGSLASDPKAFDGFRSIVGSLASTQTIDYATNGSTIASAGAQTTLNKLNSLVDACIDIPTAFYTNRTVLNHLNALATATGTNEAFANYFRLEVVEIMPGVRARVGNFQGIPMYALDRDASDAEILDFDQTTGSSNVTAEIFAVCWGNGRATMLHDRADGPEVLSYDDETGRHVLVDYAVALAAEHPRSVARLRGILAA